VKSEEEDEDPVGGESDQLKGGKLKKRWVNRIQGRQLRIEYAEDKAVRYKKRFGKGGTSGGDGARLGNERQSAGGQSDSLAETGVRHKYQGGTARASGSEKIDARTIKPGAALANAQRLTGAIVESRGKRTTFA
jgi:hypothetical protein